MNLLKYLAPWMKAEKKKLVIFSRERSDLGDFHDDLVKLNLRHSDGRDTFLHKVNKLANSWLFSPIPEVKRTLTTLRREAERMT